MRGSSGNPTVSHPSMRSGVQPFLRASWIGVMPPYMEYWDMAA